VKQELWRQAEDLFHAALERLPEERRAFLEEACGGDIDLQRQVEALISNDERAGSFLEKPLLAEASSLLPGTMLCRYRVEEKLGQGGMAVVYRAFDTQLCRRVALKVLPPEHHEEPRRRNNILNEARAASALNHPNIIAVYEVNSDAGVDFIAMELVEGKSLREIIPPRGLPIREVLGYGVQIADALARAHACGVIHRDLKPGNIMVTNDGLVKVLDFGLAQRALTAEAEATRAPTPGVAGTPSYMSPEQACGAEVDARTDLFSFGAVLYEMATGVPPFGGATTAVVLDAVLHGTATPPDRLNPGLPPALQRVIGRALEKDRDVRYQSAADLLIDLRHLQRETDLGRSNGGATARRRRPARLRAAVGAVSLAAVLLLYFSLTRRPAIDRLAVLPVVNASADPGMDYLSDGITESLIDSLSRLPGLRVISRSSVFRYKGRETDLKAVGRELEVQALLTSRLVQRGEDISISVELVDLWNDTRIWGEQYHRRLADIQDVQGDIAREVTDKLRLHLTGEQRKSLGRREAPNNEAYQEYLKGRYFWNKRTAAGVQTGIEHFNAAIAKEPNFALAYTGLADSYAVLSTFAAVAPRDCFPQARTAALRALEIDEDIAEAHAVLGEVKALYDLDWPGAERDFKRAIRLNPGYATAHQWYGLYLARTGRFDEAFAEIKKARELDPVSLITNALAGWVLLQARRYDEAIERLRETLAMDPGFEYAHFVLGQTYAKKGMYQEAIDEFSARPETERSPACVAGLGHVYAVSGRRADAQKTLDELVARSRRGYFPAWTIAAIYLGLKDKDQAFQWLGRAVEERGENALWLKVGPMWDPLRSDPRFADLLRRLNLSP
jgi:serine/threonine protein kinase/tetratricopeptide (TPR) repeat protein